MVKRLPTGVTLPNSSQKNLPTGVAINGNMAIKGLPCAVDLVLIVPEIITPIDTESFVSGNTIPILAVLPDEAELPLSVDFYDGLTLIGTAVEYPYSTLWVGASVGAHSIAARFHYSNGDAVSNPVTITVTAANSFDPATIANRIWLDPTDNATITLVSNKISDVTNKGNLAIQTSYLQATAGNRPSLSRMRGKQCFFFGLNGVTNPRLGGALLSTIAQPYEMLGSYRALDRGAARICHIGNAGGRIQFQGTTYPRTIFGGAGGTLTGPYVRSDSIYIRFRANGVANGQLWKNTVSVAGPANGGTVTLQTPMSLGDVTAGGSGQKGCFGDQFVTPLLSAGEVTNIDAWIMEKWNLSTPGFQLMEVGDSLTEGQGSTDGDGYRQILWDDWNSRGRIGGYFIEECGHVEDVAFPGDLHYAFSGKGIAFMQTNLIPILGTPNGTQQFEPDCFILLIGTNNTREAGGETWVPGTGPGSTYEAYIDLVLDMWAKCPAAEFVLVNLPPQNDVVANPRVIAFNTDLSAPGGAWDTIEAAIGRPVVRVDLNSAVGGPVYNPAYSSDGVHLNDLGYSIFKRVLVTAVTKATRLH